MDPWKTATAALAVTLAGVLALAWVVVDGLARPDRGKNCV